MNLSITECDNCQFIPFRVDKLLVFVSNFSYDLGFAILSDDDSLKSLSNNATPLFGIQHSKIFRFWMQVCLISLHDEVIRVSNQFTAVLDARVVSGETNFRFKDEVGYFATLPDKKGISFSRFVFRGLAEDRSVFNRPEFGLSSPTGKILSVK